MATISQGFGDARSRARQGVIGDWVYSDPTRRSQWGLNSAPQAAQVSTVTVSGPTNSKVYTITVNGVNVSYTSDASATTTEVAAGLALAVNAEPARVLQERVARGDLGMKTGQGFFTWTPETQQAERARYDRLLRQGLDLLAPELPPLNPKD